MSSLARVIVRVRCPPDRHSGSTASSAVRPPRSRRWFLHLARQRWDQGSARAVGAGVPREGLRSGARSRCGSHGSGRRSAWPSATGRFQRVPPFPLLRVDNARRGFFEREEFEAVLLHLPAPLDDLARFGYLTGWRRSEIVSLTWAHVDRQRRVILCRTVRAGRGEYCPWSGISGLSWSAAGGRVRWVTSSRWWSSTVGAIR